MISDKLQQARGFESNGMLRIPGTDRPAFHVTGNVGWINDPKGDDNFTSVSFRTGSGKVRMDRTFSGFGYDIVNNRSFLVDAGQELTVRVIMDRFSIELFFNDGKQTATTTIYTPQDCTGISFEAEGNVLMDVEKYDLTFDQE